MSVPDLTDLQQIARDRYGRRKTVLVHPVTWAAAAVVTSLIFAATRKPTEFSVWLVTAAVSLGLMAFMLYHISGMIYYRWILRSKEPSVYNEMEAAKAAALKAQKEARVAQGVTDELGSTLKEISSERYRDGALMPIASNIIAKKGESLLALRQRHEPIRTYSLTVRDAAYRPAVRRICGRLVSRCSRSISALWGIRWSEQQRICRRA